MLYFAIMRKYVDLEDNIRTVLQCLLRLKEPSVLLRCRKDDLHLVENVLDSAAQEYAEKANVDPPEIIVDNQVYLPPGPTHHNSHDLYW